MNLEDKIRQAIQECNINLDRYAQEIAIIVNNPREKARLHIYYEGRRVEQAKLKLLKELLR